MTQNKFVQISIILLATISLSSTALAASDSEKKKKKPAWDAIATHTCPAGFTKPSRHCAPTVASVSAADGRLWLAWPNDGHVYVNSTADSGKTFSTPVRVNTQPQSIDANGENRPKLAIGPQGDIYLTYTIHAKQKYTGDVLFSRSLDGGKTFAEPSSINDGTTKSSLRFESVAVKDDGEIIITWLDKRDLFQARANKTPYSGSAIYYSKSNDRGESFTANSLLAHHTCECCRTVVDIEDGLRPVIVWRHIFDGARDHALIRFDDNGSPGGLYRASVDNWAIESCPHHGPSISIDNNNIYHITWFTSGTVRQGPFYARSSDQGASFDHIVEIGADGVQAEHPYVLSDNGIVYVAWKDFGDDQTRFRVMTSRDQGISWSAAKVIAVTADKSDHPLLVANNGRVFATWHTADAGFGMFDITGE
ncbi:MAG: exo-alpha-sialidase [Gammaproteobacteria bacterium]|nr:exo-alpha-sialidase [Gammaproteobacteria bacterium]